ncbi:hypothetical protein EI171_26070 [Bradyrhizobium sp. LCT2]|uniref:hypothetical protein n=1 Tax=Bradyrhizobium sp. LCT2 TaxID=2493093 RepID=UPI0013743A2A|nr:hypothetical protein [Bradyrhizobium sp. LCT2]QHP70451.1 hypothetical protein EI171_26070 [Bradyrhizobium sp. LCT2]
MVTVTSVLVGLFSGFVGWILSEFIAKPLRRALDMAADAKASLIEYTNVSARFDAYGKSTKLSDEQEKRLAESEKKYRRLSAEFYAFAQTDKAAHLILKHLLLDAEGAATALMQLSNNVGQYGGGRKSATDEAKKALKVTLV